MTATLIEAPSPATAPPEVRPRLRAMHYEPEPGTAGTRRPATQRLAAPPPGLAAVHVDHDAVRAAITVVIRIAMEVLDRRRPPVHLARHVSGAALRYWQAAVEQRRIRTPARVLRIVLCLPLPDAAEAAVVCEIDGRVRALAARFERSAPAAPWRCTALRLG